MLRRRRIDNLHAFKIHPELLRTALNLARVAEQDGIPYFFFDQHAAGTQDLFVVAFGKHNLFRIGLGLVNHGARDFVGLAQSPFELSAIGIEIDRFLGDSAAHGGFGHGGGFPHQHARIERLGNKILATKLQAWHSVGAANRIGDVFLGKIGERVSGRQLHFFIDGSGAHIESPAKDEREPEHIVDLVGIVRAAGRDDDVGAGGLRFVVGDLGVRIRHSEDDRIGRHGAHHILIDRPFDR